MAYEKYAIPKKRTLKSCAEIIKIMNKIAQVLFIIRREGWWVGIDCSALQTRVMVFMPNYLGLCIVLMQRGVFVRH
jgi:hypothetical protein